MTDHRRQPWQCQIVAAIAGLLAATGVRAGEAAIDTDLAPPSDVPTEEFVDVSIQHGNVVTMESLPAGNVRILGAEIEPGSFSRLSWSATELFEGVPVSTPVLVVNGSKPGPTLCLAAAVHGDELNGIEIVRRVVHDIDPDKLTGVVIGVPIVNVQGFRRGSRYLPDRRDLNRYFPGNPQGSAAARVAHSFFSKIVLYCDGLVDVHTGSLSRANLPQIRADLRDPEVLSLTQGFGSMVILHSEPSEGMLRYAATRSGVPTVTLEAGGPHILEPAEVKRGVKGIESLLTSLGMVRKTWPFGGEPEPIYYSSTWVRSNNGGILLSSVSLGSTVREGDVLGTITDPMNNVRIELLSPHSGRIIGMSRNQVVMPGDAAFHIGIEAEDAATVEPAQPFAREEPEETVQDETKLSE